MKSKGRWLEVSQKGTLTDTFGLEVFALRQSPIRAFIARPKSRKFLQCLYILRINPARNIPSLEIPQFSSARISRGRLHLSVARGFPSGGLCFHNFQEYITGQSSCNKNFWRFFKLARSKKASNLITCRAVCSCPFLWSQSAVRRRPLVSNASLKNSVKFNFEST